MRAKCGTQVVLFDGSGAEFPAEVEKVGRSNVELKILAREVVDRELPFSIALGVALPKGDRQKWLVEKAVELGVGKLIPLKTERGVAQPVDQALDRLRRAVIEASKQCGRNRLMEIERPQTWEDFIERSAGEPARFLAHPQDDPRGSISLPRVERPHNVYLAIGPEGGFAPVEVERAAEAGWRMVDLGRRILRIETAAFFLTALVAERYTVREVENR
jgi:16S rRNA (uracil1498-N3)-methyltransferase